MFAVTGKRTTIVQELERLTGEEGFRISTASIGFGLPGTRFVLAAGVIHGENWAKNAAETVRVNMLEPIELCEAILSTRPDARICLVGSASADLGSFDRAYAASKAGIHAYVQTRKVSAGQQLVAVAPILIRDSGMIQRRHDYPEVLERRATVRAVDVARWIRHALWHQSSAQNLVMPIGYEPNHGMTL